MLLTTRFARTALLTAALVASPLTVAPPVALAAEADYSATIAEAQKGMADVIASGTADSISLSITGPDGIIWAGTDGKIDVAGTKPSAETRYGIGSVTKVLTATAVMQLVEAGKIGLDQPVVQYLPQFRMASPEYRQITVRMLLNHTAGLPGGEYANAFTTTPYPGYAKQVLTTLASSRLKTTPGALAVYCNDCFTVAGEVVAAASGMPFTTYVERNILAPLGMTHSTFITDKMPKTGTVARTFDDGKVVPQEVTNVYASGGLVSTPTDMAAFARAFLSDGTSSGSRLLTPQSVAQMTGDQTQSTLLAEENLVLTYGLGWDHVRNGAFPAQGVRALAKNGATVDYHAVLLAAPEAGLAVFVNAAGHAPGIDQAVAVLSQAVLLQALVDDGTLASVPGPATEQPAMATPTTDDINAMLGVYPAATGAALRVTRTDGDTLEVSWLSDGKWTPAATDLTFRSDGAWWAPAPSMVSFRSITGWGRTYLVQQLPFGNGEPALQYPMAHRVAPGKPIPQAWRERLGGWIAINERPDSVRWRGQLPVLKLTTIPGLPGYVDFDGVPLDASARIARMFAQVPQNNGRDQADLVPEPGGLLRFGHWVNQSVASIPTLAAGTSTTTIGEQGYAQLLRIPAAGKVEVRGASEWKLYRPKGAFPATGSTSPATITAPKGSTLVLFGKPGARITVTR